MKNGIDTYLEILFTVFLTGAYTGVYSELPRPSEPAAPTGSKNNGRAGRFNKYFRGHFYFRAMLSLGVILTL